MKYYIDSGNIEDIIRIAACFPLSGLTTNPEILARERRQPFELYREIHRRVPQIQQFHMQVVSTETDDIVREARHMRQMLTSGQNAIQENTFFVKIPVNKSGVAAMMRLKQEGVSFTATGVFTAAQGLLAGELGASYIAPYITPISTGGFDGLETVREIAELYRRFGYTTKIIGAGISGEHQVAKAGLAGAEIVTMPAAIFDKMMLVPQTEVYTNKFIARFQDYAGKDKTLMDFS